jgi:hypothetical protein
MSDVIEGILLALALMVIIFGIIVLFHKQPGALYYCEIYQYGVKIDEICDNKCGYTSDSVYYKKTKRVCSK